MVSATIKRLNLLYATDELRGGGRHLNTREHKAHAEREAGSSGGDRRLGRAA